MDMKDRHVVVTGGGGGLGKALCERFAADGARVTVADINAQAASDVAQAIGGLAAQADVGVEAEVQAMVRRAVAHYGPVDVFVSNAGIGSQTDPFTPDAVWNQEWQVHVMSNLYAVRSVLPSMLERGEGYLVSTASAVALTNQPGTAAYVVTKHANLALAEWLALTYHERGIRVSCICPLGMRTGMLSDQPADANASGFGASTIISAEEAAARVMEGLRAEKFLILTHPQVQTYFQRKAADHDRWLAGMRRLYSRMGM
ncbi:MAG: SDR family oxidoreductase [Gammaproteobacteria bacterium]